MSAARRLHGMLSQLDPAAPAAPWPAASQEPFAQGWPQGISPPQYQAVPRFAVGDQAVLDYLNENGFAVVGDVLSQGETTTALGKIWDFMEGMGTGIDRDDPATWSNEHWMENSNPGSGLMSQHGLGHSEALWYVRGLPAVKAVWTTLLGDDDLIVSFDGMCQYRPWALDRSWRTSTGWFHCDRQLGPPVTDTPARAGECGIYQREYIQGFVNLVRTTEATGGNVVCSGSHKRYAETATEHEGNVRDILTHCPEIFERSVIAHLEAGDVFLWDDRTLHCNSPGVGSGDPVARLQRAAVYISFSRKALASPETLAARKLMIERHIGTGHASQHIAGQTAEAIASEPKWTDGKIDEVDGRKFRVAAPAKLNEYQLSLVG